METDLFHQLVYKDSDGFCGIMDYTQELPFVQVYTPQGEWCGGTGAVCCEASIRGNIRAIVKYRKEYEIELLTRLITKRK